MNQELRALNQVFRAAHWHVEPNSAVVPELLPSAQHIQIVKQNTFRTIYRVRLSALDVHVKLCRPVGLRAWLREWLRPAKALLEYHNLCRLGAQGIATLEPLAAGATRQCGPGTSVLLTRTVADAVTLGEFLERRFLQLSPHEQTRCRLQLARALGEFLARLLLAGVRHGDLHPGNLLLTWEGDEPTLRLLDVHDVVIHGSPVLDPAPVILFNRWFSLRSSRTDRLRCWRALEQCLQPHRSAADPRRIERATLASNLRFWRSRFDRCCGNNRHYQSFSIGTMRGFAVRDLDIAALRPLLGTKPRQVLKDSRSSTVTEVRIPIGGVERRLILKQFRVRSRWHSLPSLFRTNGCLRSWKNGHGFRDALLATPRPLAVWQHYRFGLAGEGFLLQEKAEGVDLHPCLKNLAALPDDECRRKKHAAIDAIAQLVRTMHDRGWSHRDLKASNLLVSFRGEVPQVTLVDLVGAARHRRVEAVRRQRDLARLNASFCNVPEMTLSDRLRFLRTYLKWGLFGKRGWQSWWRQVGQFTKRKQERNARRGRVLT